jgi:hypothetical protein
MLAQIGKTGNTYGCERPGINEPVPLCSNIKSHFRVRPAVGKLGPLVPLVNPVKDVVCAVGWLNQGRFEENYRSHGDDFGLYKFNDLGEPDPTIIRADLVGFFFCHVLPMHLSSDNEKKTGNVLTLNLVFQRTATILPPGVGEESSRLLETAPYTVAEGSKDKIYGLLCECRVLIHGRRVILVRPDAHLGLKRKLSYPIECEEEISPWGDLMRDMVAYIDLDPSRYVTPVNLRPELWRSGCGEFDSRDAHLPNRPTYVR